MKMSELSSATGVPVATVKYYLRESLLPAGTPVTATSSSYDGMHVDRLRLIRALVEGAGLTIAQVRQVAQTLDNPPDTWHDMLGTAHVVLCGPTDDTLDMTAADALVGRLRWRVAKRSRPRADLARGLARLRAGGIETSVEHLDGYAEAAKAAAAVDLAALPTDSLEAALRHAIVGTALLDNVLIALRRLAQEHLSEPMFGSRPTSAGNHQAS